MKTLSGRDETTRLFIDWFTQRLQARRRGVNNAVKLLCNIRSMYFLKNKNNVLMNKEK
jgi:hypothetical protein